MTGGGRKKKKKKKKERKRRRESRGGDRQASGGGGQGGGEWGVVVEEGGVGGRSRGRGTWWRPTPPKTPPSKLILPHWLLKALGPTSAAAHKAALVPWSAQALQ